MLEAKSIRPRLFKCDDCGETAVCSIQKTPSWDADWSGLTTLCAKCAQKLALALLDISDKNA